MSTVIYARVSTPDQTVEPQLLELRRAAHERGLTIINEITDTISGTTAQRPGLDILQELIRSRAITTLMVVKLDRLARSLSNFCRLVDLMKAHDVALIIPGQGIDTTKTNPCGEMQLAILAAVAQFERSLISERTKAGLLAARARGKVLGRPSTAMPPPALRVEIVRTWIQTGRPGGFAHLGQLLGGVSPSTAWRVFNSVDNPPVLEVD